MADDFVIAGEIRLDDHYSDELDRFEQRIEQLQEKIARAKDAGSMFDPEAPFESAYRLGGIGEGSFTDLYAGGGDTVGGNDLANTLQKLHTGLRDVGDEMEQLGEHTNIAAEKLRDAKDNYRDAAKEFSEIFDELDKVKQTAAGLKEEREIFDAAMKAGKVSEVADIGGIATLAEKLGPIAASLTEGVGAIIDLASGPLGWVFSAGTVAMGVERQMEKRATAGDISLARQGVYTYMTGDEDRQLQKELEDALHGYITDLGAASLILQNYTAVQGETTDKIKELNDVAATIVDSMGGKATDVGPIASQLAIALDQGDIGAISRISGGLYDFREQAQIWSAQTRRSFAGLSDEERQRLLMGWMETEAGGLMAQGLGWENLDLRTSKADVAKAEMEERLNEQLSELRKKFGSPADWYDEIKAGFYKMVADVATPKEERMQQAEEMEREWNAIVADMARRGVMGPIETERYQSGFVEMERLRTEYDKRLAQRGWTSDVMDMQRRQAEDMERWLASINQGVGARTGTERLDYGIVQMFTPAIIGAQAYASPAGNLAMEMPAFRGGLTDVTEWSQWISKMSEMPGISDQFREALETLGQSMTDLAEVQIQKVNEAMQNTGHEFQSLAEAFLGPNARLEQLIGMYEQLPASLQSVFQGRATMAAGEYIQDRILGPEQPNRTFSAVVGGAHQLSNLLLGTYMSPRNTGDVSAEETSAALKRLLEDWTNFNSELERLHSQSAIEMQVYRSSYLSELNELVTGNKEALEDMQEAYRNRMGLRSSATGVLMSRLTPTQEDFLATELGQYKEAPMEEVRQLQNFIQYGGDKLIEHLNDPNYQKSIELLSKEAIEKALGGDDRLLKLESMRLQREFLDLRRLPKDLSSFDEAYRDWMQGQAARESNLQYLEQHLRSLGYTGDINKDLQKFFGLTTPELELKLGFEAKENAAEELIKKLAGNDEGVLELPVKLKLAEETKDAKSGERLANKLGVVDAEAFSKDLSDIFSGISISQIFIREALKDIQDNKKHVTSLGRALGEHLMDGVARQMSDDTSYIFKALVSAVLREIAKNKNGSNSGDNAGSESQPIE